MAGFPRVLFGQFTGRAKKRRGVLVKALTTVVATVALSPYSPAATGTATSSQAAGARASAVTVPSSPPDLSLVWALPSYPVGRQLRWLIGVATRPPLPAAQLRAHFDATFLQLVPPATFNEDLEALHLQAPVRVTSLEAGLTNTALAADLASGGARFGLVISVDANGLVDGLRVAAATALPSAPATWSGLDAEVRSLAPDVSFEVTTVTTPTMTSTASTTGTTSPQGTRRTGDCHIVNSVAPAAARPLGSMFKLYVLAAVASDISAAQLSWDEEIPLTAALRSLPSGFLQIEPAGTRYTVSDLAQIMVSSSDNTAADRLAALVGRRAIEAQVASTSVHAALDEPFLRTRELFVLKYASYPHYARAYLGLPVTRRVAYLDNVVDRVPLSDIDINAASSGAPRDIGSIEWFASPADICALYSQLYAEASSALLAPISTALSYNNGGAELAPSTWPLLWFKGGSEQGVLTLSYLGRRADGTVVVVVLQLSDPAGPIGAEATLESLSDVDEAFALVPPTTDFRT